MLFAQALIALAISSGQSLPVDPPSVSLDHVAIQVADLNRSVSFYQNVFGFRETAAPFPIARWLVMANGATLHIVSGRQTPRTNERWDHFAVSCRDIDAQIAILDARGISWTDIQGRRRIQIRPDGVAQIFIQDPDGYWIEINGPAGARQRTP